MPSISFNSVNKVYDGGVRAVSSFSLDVENGEFLVLVGASGCGKSTILRMLAGLEEITSGQILVDGTIINNLPPRKRDIALVFQHYALFPNLNVYKNIAIGINKLEKMTSIEMDKRVREVADFLGITELLTRKPNTLSGGQRQRVALARAIVRQPKILLLDEPLSSLDAKFRAEIRAEILKIKKTTNATCIYVTHDQTEAMTLADRIVVLNEGVIQQIGTPKEIYNQPQNIFTAAFFGTPKMNFFHHFPYKDDNKENKENDNKENNKENDNENDNELNYNKENDSKVIAIAIRPEDIYIDETIKNSQKTPQNLQIFNTCDFTKAITDDTKSITDGYIKLEVNIDFIEETGSDSILNCKISNPTQNDNQNNQSKKICDPADNQNIQATQICEPNLTIKIKSGHSLSAGDKLNAYLDIKKLHFFDLSTKQRIRVKDW